MIGSHRCTCLFESSSGNRWNRKRSLQTAVHRFRKMTALRLMRLLQRESSRSKQEEQTRTVQGTHRALPSRQECRLVRNNEMRNQLDAEADIPCVFFNRGAFLRAGSFGARTHNRRRLNTAPRLGRQGLTFSSPPHVPRVRYISADSICKCCAQSAHAIPALLFRSTAATTELCQFS